MTSNQTGKVVDGTFFENRVVTKDRKAAASKSKTVN